MDLFRIVKRLFKIALPQPALPTAPTPPEPDAEVAVLEAAHRKRY